MEALTFALNITAAVNYIIESLCKQVDHPTISRYKCSC